MASQESVLACDTCGLAQRVQALEPGTTAECIRCGSPIMSRPLSGVQTTAALTIAARVLYVPANIYPILRMNLYGTYSANTIWDGVVSLMQYNGYFVAAIVRLASIVWPL